MATKGGILYVLIGVLPTLRLTGHWARLARVLLGVALLLLIGSNLIFSLGVVLELRQRIVVGPDATLSDFYVPWRAAHDLLLNGINPYAPEQTLLYEYGYYGGPHPPPEVDSGWYKGFSYPLFLCLLIAPLAILPFWIVQPLTVVSFLVLLVWYVMLWSRLAGWLASRQRRLWAGLLFLSSLPAVYLIALQQVTGLALAVLSLAGLALYRGRLGWAGVFFALAAIKPHLSLLAFVGVLIYLVRRKQARPLLAGFLATLTVLMLASMALQPDWPLWFINGLQAYEAGNDAWGVLTFIPEGILRLTAMVGVAVLSVLASTVQRRPLGHGSQQLAAVLALTIAATLMINYGSLLYNTVLVAIPLLVVIHQSARHPSYWVSVPAWIGVGLFGSTLALSPVLILFGSVLHPPTIAAMVTYGYVFAPVPLWFALMMQQWIPPGQQQAVRAT